MTMPDREPETTTTDVEADRLDDTGRADRLDDTGRADRLDDTGRADRLDDSGREPTLVDGSDELFERWQRAQAAFVDAPRDAVQEAGQIVEDVLGRLRESFGSERSRLEAAWDAGDEPSTEDLRLALRRYRTFFERLLAA